MARSNPILFAAALAGCGAPSTGSDALAPAVDRGALADASSPGAPDLFSGPRFAALAVAADGTKLVDGAGGPIDFRGAISCCGGGYGWPLFDEAWADLAAANQVGFLHARLGPFLTGAGGESDWAQVGGGYADAGGKADLDRWNDPFWQRLHSLIEYAGQHGMRVEIDLADGWAIKHCRAGNLPGYSAWDPGWNVQGEDLCAAAGSSALSPGDRHDAWVRKVLRETVGYANVIYQDGNEVGLVPGYDPAWTRSLGQALRDEEARAAAPAHLFGTNSGDGTAIASPEVGYVELHQATAADPSRCGGKPCLVNEYNPDPPLEPAALLAQFCAAEQSGTYFWYWRHGQSDAAMRETLALIAGGCQ